MCIRDRLQRLLRGIKRVQPIPSRLPITMDLMRVLQKGLDLNNADHIMLWEAYCVGFFGFLRAGEFTVNSIFEPDSRLLVCDLQVDCLLNPSCLKIHIKCSKTDPFHSGCDVYLGKGNPDVCPLAAISSYLHVREEAPGGPLSRQILASKVNHILHSAGYPGTYSGHSFRIGAATTAASCGVPDHLIKTLGRWSSDAYQVYIRTPISSIVQVTSQLLQ